ncbi:PEP-CTERM sorting domain-containing protein [Pontiellaceae bacterium B12219]|nr:PEP-CTERM sorting domain-containing protein [Pontiellaceae bacterium B12219]
MMKKIKKIIGVTGMAVLMAGVSQAAVIVDWESTAGLTGDTDVSTLGALEYAYNLGATDSFTVNTVAFDGTGGGGIADLNNDGNVMIDPIDNGADAGFSNLSGDFGSLLGSAQWLKAAGGTITLGNLTDGQEYQVQVFSSDTRSGRNNVLVLDGGTAGEFTSLGNGSVAAGGAGGTYVIGTFTADATGEASFFADYLGSGNANINAIQIRAIPEPATIGLVAAFGGGILFIRRRLMI